MRRARFKHCAHIVCDIFCGWEKYPDESVFRQKREGTIQANVLAPSATIDGVPYDFNALHAARSWLLRDLASSSIEASELTAAELELRFWTTGLDGSPQGGFALHFEGWGLIVSGDDRYQVPYRKQERYAGTI